MIDSLFVTLIIIVVGYFAFINSNTTSAKGVLALLLAIVCFLVVLWEGLLLLGLA